MLQAALPLPWPKVFWIISTAKPLGKGTLQAPDGTVSGSVECAADELPVSSIREGEVPGIHSIRYDSEADSITITHDAKTRSGFALGAVLAAEYTAGKQGFLGMSDLFPF